MTHSRTATAATTLAEPLARQQRKARARTLGGVAAGNFVEWFDFAVYGYSATTISRLFFPAGDQVTALLGTLAIFGVTFLSRPAGGIFFGRLGDRIGRRNTLAVIILLMGGCTALIGLLPTYGTLGVLAPILLALLRLGQGFSGGGEASGGSTFLSEHAPPGERGKWSGISNSTQALPFVFAALVIYGLEHALPAASYLAWGWRVPFLLSAPLSLVGLFLRMKLDDTPVFLSLEKSGEIEPAPLRTVLTSYRKEVLLLIGIASLNAVAFYTMSSYMTTYLKQVVRLDAGIGLISNAAALCAYSALIPYFGHLGDRYGRKKIILLGAVALAVLAIPGYLTAGHGGLLYAIAGQLMLTVPLTLVGSVVAVAQCELFPSQVRYTGAALGYNIGYMLFGGTAPFVAQYLVVRTGDLLSPAYYLIALAVIALVPILLLPETSTVSMSRKSNHTALTPSP